MLVFCGSNADGRTIDVSGMDYAMLVRCCEHGIFSGDVVYVGY